MKMSDYLKQVETDPISDKAVAEIDRALVEAAELMSVTGTKSQLITIIDFLRFVHFKLYEADDENDSVSEMIN